MSENRKRKSSPGDRGRKAGIKEILINTCCIFTIAIFALYVLTSLILGKVNFSTNLGNTAAIFALSFALSAATLVFDRKKLPFWESSLILYFLIGAIYYLIVVRLSGMHTDLKGTLTAMAIYTVLFLIYVIVRLVIRKTKNRKTETEREKDYQSKF